ncbi:MAG: Crp/Fnr family transcriptional regulator [Verrucomicrobiales bacterium]|nr:Crp/Fnr family transcriptional regulator [Verrucomicrobiales bacterium]
MNNPANHQPPRTDNCTEPGPIAVDRKSLSEPAGQVPALQGALSQNRQADMLEAADRNSSPSPLLDLISAQPFFQGLSPAHLHILSECAMVMDFEPGQYILEPGAPANRFYLILEGLVVVEAELAGHGMLPIETLGPGEDLGWSWLFPPYYMHSGARVVEKTRTIFFYATRLREHCEQDHEFAYQMMRRIAEVVVRRLNATQKRLLECSDIKKLTRGS